MPAGPSTTLSDLIEPEIFLPYTQNLTMEKTALFASGAVASDASLTALISGGGLTFHLPQWDDLDNTAARVTTEDDHAEFTGGTAEPDPLKTGAFEQVAVRCNRNQSWSNSALSRLIIGQDPMESVMNRVAEYWAREWQRTFIAVMTGIFTDNDSAPGSSEHVQGDLTHDISGSAFSDGVTNFSAEAVIDAAQTMGDAHEQWTAICVHSVIKSRMKKLNLIDYIPDSEGRVNIETFHGRRIVVDDAMPVSGGVYQTWLLGDGAMRWGEVDPPNAVVVERKEGAANGGGQEILYNRKQFCIHPEGHTFVGTPPKGGPSNAASSGNFAHSNAWRRVAPERKQIRIARLISREA